MAKKRKELFHAVYRPSEKTIVITRSVDGGDEEDIRTIATDVQEGPNLPTLITEAQAMVRADGWTFPTKAYLTPRTIVRLDDDGETEWVWVVRPDRTEVVIEISERDFRRMLIGSSRNTVTYHEGRYQCDESDFLDPRLVSMHRTRGRAEGIIAREYLRANGFRAVEAWDTQFDDPKRPWREPGPVLLTDRPLSPQEIEKADAEEAAVKKAPAKKAPAKKAPAKRAAAKKAPAKKA